MNKLKKDGKKMELLKKIAARGEFGHPSDRECFPPSKAFQPLEKAGLAFKKRTPRWSWFGPYMRVSTWHLTEKGRKCLGL